jgi:two-component system chemotaxis response regulator CheV
MVYNETSYIVYFTPEGLFMDTGILLESGTNELEILEFMVGDNSYGINVAKIKEIIPYKVPTPIPNSHPGVEGIFMPRETIYTVVDLAYCLNLPPSEVPKSDMYIVTNFNMLDVSFHVHKVVGIHRVTWADILKPDSTMNNQGNGVATGIIKFDTKLVVILDFEKIITDISPETGLKVSEVDELGARRRNIHPILMAEDSPFLSKMIHECLTKAGYVHVTVTANGEEAWNKLVEFKEKGIVLDEVSLIITDIEMPRMDGHRLTKLIKNDPVLNKIPVVIFSSLVNPEMAKKGESLGVDLQLSKPEIGRLVTELDKLLEDRDAAMAAVEQKVS